MKIDRLNTLCRPLVLFALLTAIGCGGSGGGGGGGGSKTASVSGTVIDVNGQPVRGARVSCRDGSTTTSTTGAFILRNVREDNLDIHAEIVQNGVRFKGRNVAVTFRDERTQSVNIVVAPERQLASIFGVVQDRDGFRLGGASIFAAGAGFISQRTVANANGEYELFGLVSGVSYTVVAGGREYRSDVDAMMLTDGERRRVNFVLSNPGNPQMPAPEDLTAVSWTSPPLSRSAREREAIENVKRLFDPEYAKRKAKHTRLTPSGNYIEVGLDWTPVDSLELLGYGIYRGRNAGGPFTAIDFYREPLVGYFVDLDDVLRPNQNYYYQITSLSVVYPNDPNRSESPPSDTVLVTPLPDLDGLFVTNNPIRFNWNDAQADGYVVFLFDEFPGVGVESFWNNANAPTSDTSLEYAGPSLVRGQRYYYLVLGLADDNKNRTVSGVGEFVAP